MCTLIDKRLSKQCLTVTTGVAREQFTERSILQII